MRALKSPFPVLVAVVLLLVGCGPSIGVDALMKGEDFAGYEAAAAKKLAGKYESKLSPRKYVRFVVEESDASGKQWRERESIPNIMLLKKVLFVFLIKEQPVQYPDGERWLVKIRLGGESRIATGWSGSSFGIPAPTGAYTCEVSGNDPERLFNLRSDNRQVRFRLEFSDTAYPQISL